MNEHRQAQKAWDSRFTSEILAEHDRQRLSAVLEILPKDIKIILDVGCGDGRISNQLLPLKIDIVGLDISWVGLLKSKLIKVNGDISLLPFPGNTFDLVLCGEVLEHFPDDTLLDIIKELVRVSFRYILVTVPNNENREFGLVRCSVCYAEFHASYHVRSFNIENLTELFSREGCRVIEYKTSGSRKYSSLFLTKLTRLTTGYYEAARKGVICPVCGNDAIIIRRPRQNGLSLILMGINKVLGVFFPSSPENLVMLLQHD